MMPDVWVWIFVWFISISTVLNSGYNFTQGVTLIHALSKNDNVSKVPRSG